MTLKCPDFPEYENIDPTDVLDRSHYEFQALVNEDGQCDFEYLCRHPVLPKRSKSGSQNLVGLAAKELQGQEPQCGSFWINLYVWDRTKDYLSQSDISARELTAQSGVSLFRDGLRVLPYGEPGNDWLLLDQERIQDPSGRIGNNQVIGLVQVLQEQNLRLRDKTNREGLIENEAFLDLKAMTRAVVRLFTSYWKKDRPRDEGKSPSRKGSLALAKEVANALRETASDEVEVAILASPPATAITSTADVPRENGIERKTVTQKEAVEILIDNIEGAAAISDERDQRIDRLLSLAATGLAAERVVHEFGRQVAAALEALSRLPRGLRSDQETGRALEVLEACLGTLRNEFRILAPYESVDRAQRARVVSLTDAGHLALTINRRVIEESRVEASVEGEEFQITGRPGTIVQVLDNLVHNSCYWLSTLPAGRTRRLAIVLDGQNRRVVVADSGPGVHEEARQHLFEPFFSMKAGGTGLGLYISREIMRRMNGSIEVPAVEKSSGLPTWANGAVFIMNFGGKALISSEKSNG